MEDGITLVDEAVQYVDNPMAEKADFARELDEYMGHDPIEALVERENEKQRLVIESNHRVIRTIAVVFTLSFLGTLLNVLTIVYERDFWPTPRLLRRLMRRVLRSSLRGSGFPKKGLKSKGEKQPLKEKEKARARVRHGVRRTSAVRVPGGERELPEEDDGFASAEEEEQEPQNEEAVFSEEVTCRKWEADEPPDIERVSDVSSVATSSAEDSGSEDEPLTKRRV